MKPRSNNNYSQVIAECLQEMLNIVYQLLIPNIQLVFEHSRKQIWTQKTILLREYKENSISRSLLTELKLHHHLSFADY